MHVRHLLHLHLYPVHPFCLLTLQSGLLFVWTMKYTRVSQHTYSAEGVVGTCIRAKLQQWKRDREVVGVIHPPESLLLLRSTSHGSFLCTKWERKLSAQLVREICQVKQIRDHLMIRQIDRQILESIFSLITTTKRCYTCWKTHNI